MDPPPLQGLQRENPSEAREQENKQGREAAQGAWMRLRRFFWTSALLQPWQKPPSPAAASALLTRSEGESGRMKRAKLQVRLLDSRKQAHDAQQGLLIPWTSSCRLAGEVSARPEGC